MRLLGPRLLPQQRVAVPCRPDLLQRAEPVICAFDIECTKLPLQFPNADYDQVCVPGGGVHLCMSGRAPRLCWLPNQVKRTHASASLFAAPLQLPPLDLQAVMMPA
jgi:hypothetical protein